jgi:hypothetical protein
MHIPFVVRRPLRTRPFPVFQGQVLLDVTTEETSLSGRDNLSTFPIREPYPMDLYSSWRTNSPQPASEIDFAKGAFVTIPTTINLSR